ncbi:MAG: hypothetical protein JWR26_3097 [Pedosphaera sp.]|nr:hypothetical protein [Pedosphaera sp.]
MGIGTWGRCVMAPCHFERRLELIRGDGGEVAKGLNCTDGWNRVGVYYG